MRFQVLEVVPRASRRPGQDVLGTFNTNVERTDPFTVWLFGRTLDGASVAVRVTGFRPFFYLKATSPWGPAKWASFRHALNRALDPATLADMSEPEFVQAKDMYGFRGLEKETFCRLSFRTEPSRSNCKYAVKKLQQAWPVETYEANVHADMQLTSTLGLVSWVELDPARSRRLSDGASKCQHTFEAPFVGGLKCLTADECDDVAPMRILSLDIETASTDRKTSEPERDRVFMISASARTAFVPEAESRPDRHLFALPPVECEEAAPVPYDLHICPTERELLLAFARFVSDGDFDLLTGWNVDGFDYRYLFLRAKVLGCLPEFGRLLSRISTSSEPWPVYLQKEQFTTRAFGSSTFHRLHCLGRINLDLLFYVRRTEKYEKYSLAKVSEAIFGESQKLDVSYLDMWRAAADGDARTLGRVAHYAVVDADVVVRIADAKDVWIRLLEQSRVTFVPIAQLGSHGEQVKTFSQILRIGHEKGYLVVDSTFQRANDLYDGGENGGGDEDEDAEPYIDDNSSYAGGYVLDPVCGAYFDSPVHVMDFQSLYPSIIRAHLLCFSSNVSWVFSVEKYGNLPGFEYVDHVIDETHTFRFCRHEETILPKLQDSLFAKRQAVKAMLKHEKDPFKRQVLDARQLGLKLAMNASYGFLAANRLKCKPIGQTITAIGRQMIIQTRDYIEANVPFAKVLYGDTDSVFMTLTQGDTAIGEFDCDALAGRITQELFRRPIKLEYEKSYLPFLLMAKKRYMGMKFPAGSKEGYKDSRGDVLARRDVPQAVKDLYDEMCDLILANRQEGVSTSIARLRETLEAVVERKIPAERLAVTRQMTKAVADYTDKSHLPHVEVAKKKQARGQTVSSNDRIQIVIAAPPVGSKPTADWQRAEDLDFVLARNVPYDITYYIGVFETPTKNLLGLLVPPTVVDGVFRKALAAAKRVSQGNADIRAFFGTKRPREDSTM